MMTKEEAAAQLDGCEYTKEGSRDLWKAMADAGLVAVFGASDDLMEFRGAIRDEVGSYNGGTAYLTSAGLLVNDCDDDNCPHFARAKENAATIEAIWDRDGISWQYETEIPHVTFKVKEDGGDYCEGIVFRLADVVAP
ncbi:MAG: hypothetical protein ACOY3N_09550 [Bradyrhizobium sp.]|uniref:hypothetical protein n=1 Tax=Bradyrhizobium sp. TaxID=376 RepID=UPI003BF097DE